MRSATSVFDYPPGSRCVSCVHHGQKRPSQLITLQPWSQRFRAHTEPHPSSLVQRTLASIIPMSSILPIHPTSFVRIPLPPPTLPSHLLLTTMSRHPLFSYHKQRNPFARKLADERRAALAHADAVDVPLAAPPAKPPASRPSSPPTGSGPQWKPIPISVRPSPIPSIKQKTNAPRDRPPDSGIGNDGQRTHSIRRSMYGALL